MMMELFGCFQGSKWMSSCCRILYLFKFFLIFKHQHVTPEEAVSGLNVWHKQFEASHQKLPPTHIYHTSHRWRIPGWWTDTGLWSLCSWSPVQPSRIRRAAVEKLNGWSQLRGDDFRIIPKLVAVEWQRPIAPCAEKSQRSHWWATCCFTFSPTLLLPHASSFCALSPGPKSLMVIHCEDSPPPPRRRHASLPSF